jgi:hypothetical protein
VIDGVRADGRTGKRRELADFVRDQRSTRIRSLPNQTGENNDAYVQLWDAASGRPIAMRDTARRAGNLT